MSEPEPAAEPMSEPAAGAGVVAASFFFEHAPAASADARIATKTVFFMVSILSLSRLAVSLPALPAANYLPAQGFALAEGVAVGVDAAGARRPP